MPLHALAEWQLLPSQLRALCLVLLAAWVEFFATVPASVEDIPPEDRWSFTWDQLRPVPKPAVVSNLPTMPIAPSSSYVPLMISDDFSKSQQKAAFRKRKYDMEALTEKRANIQVQVNDIVIYAWHSAAEYNYYGLPLGIGKVTSVSLENGVSQISVHNFQHVGESRKAKWDMGFYPAMAVEKENPGGKKKPASRAKKSMDTIDHADIEMKVIFKACKGKTKHLSVESLKRPGCTL